MRWLLRAIVITDIVLLARLLEVELWKRHPRPSTSPAWSSWSPPPQLDHGHLLQLLYALPACVWKWKGWGDLYFYFSESFLVLTLPRISQSRQSCLLFQQGLLTQLASVQRHCAQRRVRCTKSVFSFPTPSADKTCCCTLQWSCTQVALGAAVQGGWYTRYKELVH